MPDINKKKSAFPAPDYETDGICEFYSKNIMTEYMQSIDEGLDMKKYENLFKAVDELDSGEIKEKLADVLYDAVFYADRRDGFEFTEPTDYICILENRANDIPTKRQPDPDTLREKIAGAWYGRICGCLLGKPVEGMHTKELSLLLRETCNYPMHRYIKRGEISDELLNKVGEWIGNNPFADVITNAPADDDTNYTVLYQELISERGRDFKSDDVLHFWAKKQPINAYYTAEKTAFLNFANGYKAPETAIHKNPCREWIGAQIRGDYFGYINPGDPEAAAEMAHRDAVISHIKNGVYGEMFISALIAIAAVENDMQTALKQALKFIPQKSRLVHAVTAIIDEFNSGASSEDCFAGIHSRWDEYKGHHWCHTISNAEIVTASLLYGRGDYTKTVCLAVQTGFDTDCNAATAGSVLGMMKGISAIGSEWTAPINGRLDTQIMGVGTVSIDERIELTLRHIEK